MNVRAESSTSSFLSVYFRIIQGLKGIRTFPKNESDFTRRKSGSDLVPIQIFRALATLGSAHELFPFGRSPSSRPVILRLATAKHSVTDHEEGERCGLLRLSREPLSLDP